MDGIQAWLDGQIEQLNPFFTWFAGVGDFWWLYVVMPVLAAVGLYFTVRSGVVQARMLPAMIKCLQDKALIDEDGNKKSVSAFQAFTISAASRVGSGNVAGVALAIAVGGPGAIFWMWLMAFIGGASSMVESTLGQLYKVRGKDGYHGGPAYYIQRGLGQRWLGIVFAILLILCFPFAFSAIQASVIKEAIFNASPVLEAGQGGLWLGVIVAAVAGAVFFGGLRRIAHVTSTLVPVMALSYILIGIFVIAFNIGEFPRVIGSIFAEAFNFQAGLGALIGSVIITGAKRGMFSNEAGLGSAPNAGASASVTHPVKQGLVQTLGVYFDTFIICTITAFIILSTTPDVAFTGSGTNGIVLTQNALVGNFGNITGILLAVIIFMLAFSSILGNYYYGESNVRFITESPIAMTVYRVLAILAILAGVVLTADAVWGTADTLMGFMAIVNLASIFLLSGIAFKLLANYEAQLKNGKDPVFLATQMPELKGIECWEEVDVTTNEIPIVKRKVR